MASFHNAFSKVVKVPTYPQVLFHRIATSSQSHKMSIEERLGIKPKPKRPLSAFFRFTSEIKPSLMKEHPNASVTEIVKMSVAQWKVVDASTKTRLQEEYKREWAKYLEECKKYEQSLSPGDRQEIRLAKQEVKEAKQRRLLKKKEAETGKPKKPPSTFVYFMLSKMSERGDLPYKEWQSKIGKEWESLGEEEKRKFAEKRSKDTEEYKAKMAEWERGLAASTSSSGPPPMNVVRSEPPQQHFHYHPHH